MKYKYLCIILINIFCFFGGIQDAYSKTCKYSGNIHGQNVTFNIMIQDGTKSGCMWFDANGFIKPGKYAGGCGEQGYTPKLPWESSFYECPNTLYYYDLGFDERSQSLDVQSQKRYIYVSTLSNVNPQYFTNYSDIQISSLTQWHSKGILSHNESKPNEELQENQQTVGNFCTNSGVKTVLKLIGYVVQALRWLIPIIIIVLGIFDFSKAAISSDDKALASATSSLAKRVISGIIIFILPSVVNAILNFIGLNTRSNFEECTSLVLDVFNPKNN